MRTKLLLLVTAAAVMAGGSVVAQEYKSSLSLVGITPSFHKNVSNGSGVTVAILDGWIDAAHGEFEGRVDNKGLSSGTYKKADKHGTHVAGIVGAAANGKGMVGVAPKAKLLGIGMFDDDGWVGQSNGTSIALNYAVQQNATVVNMSYNPTTRGDVFMNGELKTFKGFGDDLVLVRAAGNAGRNVINEEFAGNPQTDLGHVLIVGSINMNKGIASYSNKPGNACFVVNGSCAEKNKLKYFWIVAPGTSKSSTTPKGSYGNMTGTSMAAPQVAGAAALLQSEWPHLKSDPAQVASILKSTATDLGAKGVDAVYGYGLLNVAKALQPVGTTRIATGSSVASGTATKASTIAYSSGLMEQRGLSEAFAGLVVFDAYGRDFKVGLDAERDRNDGEAMLDRLGALGLALQQQDRAPVLLGDMSFSFVAGAGLDGSVLNQADLTQGGFGLTLGWGAPLGQAALLLTPGNDDPRALLRRELGLGLGELSQELEQVTFASGSFELAPGVSLAAFHASDAQPEGNDVMAALSKSENGSVSMTGARLGVDVAEGLVLGLSWSQLGESDQLLGGESSGALAMASEARTDLVGLSLAYDVTEDLSLFAFWQEGWSRADSGSASLFEDTDDWRSRRYGVTVGLKDALGEGDRLELSLVRPLTVTSGSGEARVPVGRTLDGQVVYEEASFDVGSDAEPLEVGLTWLGAREEWAPGRPLAYGVSLGWSSDDVASDRGDASVLFAVQAKF